MEEVVIHSPAKPWLRKVAMLIFTWGPILSWYKISFPVPLGYALILFVSILGIIMSGAKVRVLPSTFLWVFIYVCGLWMYNHHFGLWTLFPPGGWVFFIFAVGIVGGILLFDMDLCRKYMRWVVWIAIGLFFIQFGLLVATGSQQFCFVPPLTSEFTYEGMTYSEIVVRHLTSVHPCSIFLEKSYMAYYLVAYLSLIMFSGEGKGKLYSKEILIISLTLIILRSGSGIVGLAVLWVVKAFSMFWTKNKKRRISMILLMVPFAIGVFYIYGSTEAGQEIFSRQDELTTEDTSGYVRVMGGYAIYDMLTPQEKMIGKPDAQEAFGKDRADGTTWFYINGVQTILVYLGFIGALLYLFFYASVFRKVALSSRMCLITLLTMALLESNYLNPYMLLLTIIPCAEYYYNYKLTRL